MSARISTIYEAWETVWGKSSREKCFVCGQWTSIHVGAQELFEPDWPPRPPVTDWDFAPLLPQIAGNPLWRRFLYCPTCYDETKGSHGSFVRRGIPTFTEKETKDGSK